MKKVNKEKVIIIAEESTSAIKLVIKKVDFMSKNNVKSAFSRGQITINDKIAKATSLVNPGDKVRIDRTGRTHFTVKHDIDLNIIYEDQHLIAINKPAGLLTIATEKERFKTLYHITTDYVKKTNINNRIFIVHRLDRETSGVVLFAKSESAKKKLQDKWNKMALNREYVAIVEKNIYPRSGEIKNCLKETKTNKVYSSEHNNGGQEAITKYEVIKHNKNYSMLKINLLTGRKNQIRVHMNDLETSIIGDKKYGSTINPIKRMGLHANELKIIHPVTNKELTLNADIPKEFLKLF